MPAFEGLCKKVSGNLQAFMEYGRSEQESYFKGLPLDYDEKLNNFEKLLMLKVFKPQKLMFASKEYIAVELGSMYAEAPVSRMDALFADSTKVTPIIFVLSTGADPTDELIKFAQQQGMSEGRFVLKSLGQGQDRVAA